MKNTSFISENAHLLWLFGANVSLMLGGFVRMWKWGVYWDGFFTGAGVALMLVGIVSMVRKFREMWKKTKQYGNH